jgi:hypothetical protein
VSQAVSQAGPRFASRPAAEPFGAPAPYPRTPLDADERARAPANFVPLVAQSLVTRGRFEISAAWRWWSCGRRSPTT